MSESINKNCCKQNRWKKFVQVELPTNFILRMNFVLFSKNIYIDEPVQPVHKKVMHQR